MIKVGKYGVVSSKSILSVIYLPKISIKIYKIGKSVKITEKLGDNIWNIQNAQKYMKEFFWNVTGCLNAS